MQENEMVMIVGMHTNRTYAEGRRSDCMKYLLAAFPYRSTTRFHYAKVFDEPLKIIRTHKRKGNLKTNLNG